MGQTDARTDIYCLGATLYHLVTGKNPCEPPYEIRPIREINPNLSSGLERIILKCTQRDPNDRYQSAAELMYALEHYEEVDDSYRKKQKRKLALFLAPVVLALLFAGASVWGYLSAEKQRTADYDFILAEAANESDPTTALNRYYEAITTDPTRTDAYLGNDDFSGMIDYLTRDGELTVSESSWLSRLKAGLDQKGSSGYSSTVDVLEELRAADPSGYEQVCYEIGEAYLFYYSVPVEKDRYAAAATWFQYAKEGYPIADMYCQISACLQNIAKYEKAEQHAKLYEEYQSLWSQILKLKTDANDFDDDLKLRIWNEITNMIQNNAKAFCEVTPPEEILAAIDEISADSEKITNTFLEKSVSTLRQNIAATTNKILSYAETAE
jgi:serine/threonine-protein kinase